MQITLPYIKPKVTPICDLSGFIFKADNSNIGFVMANSTALNLKSGSSKNKDTVCSTVFSVFTWIYYKYPKL